MPRLAVGGGEQGGDVQRHPFEPLLEAGRRDQGVQPHRQLQPVLLRVERVDVERAELTDGWVRDRADQGWKVQRVALAPVVLDQIGEKHVLAGSRGIGLEADEAEEPARQTGDSLAQVLRIGLP